LAICGMMVPVRLPVLYSAMVSTIDAEVRPASEGMAAVDTPCGPWQLKQVAASDWPGVTRSAACTAPAAQSRDVVNNSLRNIRCLLDKR
jgi:hypothetical protein